MRFILSYACSPLTPEKSYFSNQIFISSVRNLLQEMADLSHIPPSNFAGSLESQFSGGYGQVPRPRGPNIEMKRGDWICPRQVLSSLCRRNEFYSCLSPICIFCLLWYGRQIESLSLTLWAGVLLWILQEMWSASNVKRHDQRGIWQAESGSVLSEYLLIFF